MLISRPRGPSQWVLQDCMMPPTPDFPSALLAPQGVQLQPVGVLLSWVYNCLSLQPLLRMLSSVPFPWIPGQSMLWLHCFIDSGKFFGQIRCYFLSSLSSVQSLSRVWLFATPWIAARQASLYITNSWSSLRLMSIESVIPSSHLILCRPLLLLPPIPPSVRIFSSESTLRMRWPKYWSFSFSIIPSKEISGLISFRMDWLDTMDQLDLIDIKRTFHAKTTNFNVFSSAHGTFSRIDHILGHESSLGKFIKIEIISTIFSDHNELRSDVNFREKKTIKNKNIWRLNNVLLNNQQITE